METWFSCIANDKVICCHLPEFKLDRPVWLGVPGSQPKSTYKARAQICRAIVWLSIPDHNGHQFLYQGYLSSKKAPSTENSENPWKIVSRKVSSFSVSFSAPCHPVASPPSVREERNAVRLGTGGGLEGQDAHQDEGLKIWKMDRSPVKTMENFMKMTWTQQFLDDFEWFTVNL